LKEDVKVKRITPEMVVAAYKATGLKPARCVFIAGDYACAVGAVAKHLSGVKHAYDAVEWANRVYGEDYVESFWHGFDDISTSRYEQHIGYEDGRAAWQACVDAGLVDG
jgi:hypothetical protein